MKKKNVVILCSTSPSTRVWDSFACHMLRLPGQKMHIRHNSLMATIRLTQFIFLPHLLKSIIVFQTSHPITRASSLRVYKAINTQRQSDELFQPMLPASNARSARCTNNGSQIDFALACKTNGHSEYMNAQIAKDKTALALVMGLLQLLVFI